MNLQERKPTFFTVDGDKSIDSMMEMEGFDPVGGNGYFKASDICIFPGGADVNPSLYKEPRHPATGFFEKRDARWQSIYGHVRSRNFLKIGICAGAQFLNVMNGGKLWQDVSNHAAFHGHEVIYASVDGKQYLFDATSTHHQMMRPRVSGEVWGFCEKSSYRDMGMDRKRPTDFLKEGPDVEVVYYPDTASLCFQPHPEYINKSCRELFFVCVNRAINRLAAQGFFLGRKERVPF